MIVALIAALFLISTEVVYLQRCLVVTWLVPCKTAAISAHSVYTIQPCTVTSLHAKPHTYGACVFSCNQPPALLAEWQGFFTCYCNNNWVERIQNFKLLSLSNKPLCENGSHWLCTLESLHLLRQLFLLFSPDEHLLQQESAPVTIRESA